jgi:diketogulonate reductase-like aldo/keto reductase
MALPPLFVRGLRVPALCYGTAWKEDATEALVAAALAAGFRAIDTANQRKHYFEAGVGKAIARALRDGLRREDLFVQTKFTFVDGQDARLPYDRNAAIGEQVVQSFRSSLEHLGLDVLDSLVLHGPSQRDVLGASDREAWAAMERLAEQGRVALLGVSNVTARQLTELVELAHVKPAFVQNRCYANRGWDAGVREICRRHEIVYQGFSLLTANRALVSGPLVTALAERHRHTAAQVIFRFAYQLGMLPLTGTSDPAHMAQDLALDDFALDAKELAAIEAAT